MKTVLVFLIAGWSGFLLMAVELLIGRMLTPNFGNSFEVRGAAITVFLLSLSLGYLLGGRISVREPALKKLASLLIAAAVVTAPTVILGHVVIDEIFIHVLDPRYGSLLASAALSFVPTMIVGMVPPYAVRLLVTESRTSGRHAGSLLFASTFGSAAGAFTTSFYLVLFLGVNQILWALIGVTVALGLTTLLFAASPLKMPRSGRPPACSSSRGTAGASPRGR